MLTKNKTKELRSDIAARVAELRPLKAALRRRWTEPMADVQRDVRALAGAITDGQILLAWSRGRRHLTSAPRWLRDLGRESELEDVQRRIAERVAEYYRESSPAHEEASP